MADLPVEELRLGSGPGDGSISELLGGERAQHLGRPLGQRAGTAIFLADYKGAGPCFAGAATLLMYVRIADLPASASLLMARATAGGGPAKV